MEDGEMDENEVPAGPGFTFDADGHIVKNRGGRPRKDGTRADTSTTFKEMGFSKRDVARMRLLASYSNEEFEAALATRHADIMARKPKRSIFHYLPDRKANSRHERETNANIARIISSARNILKAHEFDSSHEGAVLRRMAEVTIEAWSLDNVAAVERLTL
jgi:hypothetical protein